MSQLENVERNENKFQPFKTYLEQSRSTVPLMPHHTNHTSFYNTNVPLSLCTWLPCPDHWRHRFSKVSNTYCVCFGTNVANCLANSIIVTDVICLICGRHKCIGLVCLTITANWNLVLF